MKPANERAPRPATATRDIVILWLAPSEGLPDEPLPEEEVPLLEVLFPLAVSVIVVGIVPRVLFPQA